MASRGQWPHAEALGRGEGSLQGSLRPLDGLRTHAGSDLAQEVLGPGLGSAGFHHAHDLYEELGERERFVESAGGEISLGHSPGTSQ